MKATINIVYRPLEPHERTGGPNRPWLAETALAPTGNRATRTGTCRSETFAHALQLATAGVISHYNSERPADTSLDGMTSDRWKEFTPAEQDSMRDLSGLTEQLIGLEGWRVEVETTYGESRRFIVGRSTGWKPCHLEIHNRRSTGGGSAERTYQSVRKLYNTRGGQ